MPRRPMAMIHKSCAIANAPTDNSSIAPTSGQPIDAATALRDGLVSRVVPPADLDRETMAFAQHIAAQPPQQIAEGKAMFHKHMTMELDQAYAYATEFMAGAIQREDAQAGIDAFVSKKPKPDWTGR